jgi:hypothetical protein
LNQSRIRNAIRRQVALKLKPRGGHSWVNVASAVLEHQGKKWEVPQTKMFAKQIVLAFARGQSINVKLIDSPKKRTTKSDYKKAAETFYASDKWKELRYLALKNCGAQCLCCGATRADGAVLHVDHIKPRYHHPELQWELSNLQVLCLDCNIGKRAWDETDWRSDSMREEMEAQAQHMRSL